MSSPDRSLRIRLRDVAETVGITERAAQRIVTDLVESGFLERERRGRRNRYLINEKTEMRHPAQEGYEIGELLGVAMMADGGRVASAATTAVAIGHSFENGSIFFTGFGEIPGFEILFFQDG